MKLLLSFLCLFYFSSGFAATSQLGVKGGTWSFATENVSDSSQTSSGVGAYSFELGYAILPSWLLSFGFNLVMSDVFSGSSGYGLDLGGKYFPFTYSTSQNANSSNTQVTLIETWRPYVGLFMRQRIFGLQQSVSYIGPGLSIGVDYSVWSKTALSLEYRYDYLYGRGDALAIQNNILIGISMEL